MIPEGWAHFVYVGGARSGQYGYGPLDRNLKHADDDGYRPVVRGVHDGDVYIVLRFDPPQAPTAEDPAPSLEQIVAAAMMWLAENEASTPGFVEHCALSTATDHLVRLVDRYRRSVYRDRKSVQ